MEQRFHDPVRARYVRIVPQSWNREPCIRVEILLRPNSTLAKRCVYVVFNRISFSSFNYVTQITRISLENQRSNTNSIATKTRIPTLEHRYWSKMLKRMEQEDDVNIRGRVACVGYLAKMEMMHLSSNALTSTAIDSIGDLYAIMSGLEVNEKKSKENDEEEKSSKDEEQKMLNDMNERLQKSDVTGDTASWISNIVSETKNQDDDDEDDDGDGTGKESEEKEEEELRNETKESNNNTKLHPIISNSIRSRIRNEIMMYVRAGKPGEALLKLIPDPSVDASPLRQSAVAIVMEAISEPLNLYVVFEREAREYLLSHLLTQMTLSCLLHDQ